jgi:hypothetical protein
MIGLPISGRNRGVISSIANFGAGIPTASAVSSSTATLPDFIATPGCAEFLNLLINTSEDIRKVIPIRYADVSGQSFLDHMEMLCIDGFHKIFHR